MTVGFRDSECRSGDEPPWPKPPQSTRLPLAVARVTQFGQPAYELVDLLLAIEFGGCEIASARSHRAPLIWRQSRKLHDRMGESFRIAGGADETGFRLLDQRRALAVHHGENWNASSEVGLQLG